MFSAKINIVEQIATALQGFDDSVGVGAPIEHLPRRNHMSEDEIATQNLTYKKQKLLGTSW